MTDEMKSRMDTIASTIFAVAMLAYSALFLAKIGWPLFDYTFTVVFHAFVFSLPLFLIVLLLHGLFAILRLFGKVIPPESDSPARAVVDWFFRVTDTTSRFLSFLFTVYCYSLLIAGAALEPAIALATALGLAAGAFVNRLLSASGIHGKASTAAAAIIAALLFVPGAYLAAGTMPPAAAVAALAMLMALAAWRKRFLLSFERQPVWQWIVNNRAALAFSGLAMAAIYVLWVPVLNSGGGPEIVASNEDIGAGSDMVFTHDGNHIIYMDKSNSKAHLIDRNTLETTASIALRGSPRDVVPDPGPDRDTYYAVMHDIMHGQLAVITGTESGSKFRIKTSVTIPPGECTQINAVNVAPEHGLILIGCDSSGEMHYVKRETLEAPDDRIKNPKPSGKGIVRIAVDEPRDRAITFGCLMGPFLNVIDLDKWKLKRAIFTGYLVWEYVLDREENRFLVSVPLRSLVVIISEGALEFEGVIRAGFGARALAIDTGNRRLFVGNQVASTIEVFDLDTSKKIHKYYLPYPRYFLYDENAGMLYAATSRGLYKIKI